MNSDFHSWTFQLYGLQLYDPSPLTVVPSLACVPAHVLVILSAVVSLLPGLFAPDCLKQGHKSQAVAKKPSALSQWLHLQAVNGKNGTPKWQIGDFYLQDLKW